MSTFATMIILRRLGQIREAMQPIDTRPDNEFGRALFILLLIVVAVLAWHADWRGAY
jgi:hypothetical protein